MMETTTFLRLVSVVIFGASFFVSCQTPKNVLGELPAQNASAQEKVELSAVTVPPVISQTEQFRKLIRSITLTIVSSPESTVTNHGFSSPYTVKAKHTDGTSVCGMSVSVSYPESRSDDTVMYASTKITTDNDGIAVFIPPVPMFPLDTTISFLPTPPPSSDPDVMKIAEETAVEAPWKVRTNYTRKGGIICLVDYDLKGRPITNNSVSSSRLLMKLINSGFVNIGNADFSREIRTGKDVPEMYKAARSLVGRSAAYFIYGVVKYVKPIEKENATYSCTLAADIICLDMSSGHKICSIHQTATGSDKAEWKVLDVTRSALAQKIAEAVIYGM